MSDCSTFEAMLAVSEGLSEEESQALESHLAACETCRGRLAEYRQILSALKARRPSGHPSTELLARYAVHRCEPGEPDYDGRELAPDEVERVEAHVDACEACLKSVNLAIADYREIDAHLAGQGLSETLPSPSETGRGQRLAAVWRGLGRYSTPVYATAMAGAAALLWMSPLFRTDAERLYALASLERAEVAAVTRGDGDELSEGLTAFSRGRYPAAIEALEPYVERAPAGADTPYARYVLGLALLHEARSDFLGRMQRVDAGIVERGLAHLAAAARTTESRSLREDAVWFQAKGRLLKLDPAGALESLERVEALNGRRSAEARVLADEIRAIVEAAGLPSGADHP